MHTRDVATQNLDASVERKASNSYIDVSSIYNVNAPAIRVNRSIQKSINETEMLHLLDLYLSQGTKTSGRTTDKSGNSNSVSPVPTANQLLH